MNLTQSRCAIRQAPQRVVGPSIEVELAAFLDTLLRPQFQGFLVTSLHAWEIAHGKQQQPYHLMLLESLETSPIARH